MNRGNERNVNRSPQRGAHSRERSLARLQRDAALMRVGRARRLLIGGAAGLTAAIAYFVSSIAPGRAYSGSKHAGTAPLTAVTLRSSTMPPLASPAQLGLQSPDQAPQAAPAPPSPPPPAPSSAGAGASPTGGGSASAGAAATQPASSQPVVPAADNPPPASTGGS